MDLAWFLLLLGHTLHFEGLRVLAIGQQCKTQDYRDSIDNKALKDHVFKTEWASSDAHCESKCFGDDRCISFNYGFAANKTTSNMWCELSDSDHMIHRDDLIGREKTVYRRAKNNCKCQVFQVCRVNWLDGTHRCECKPGFTGAQCEIPVTDTTTSPTTVADTTTSPATTATDTTTSPSPATTATDTTTSPSPATTAATDTTTSPSPATTESPTTSPAGGSSGGSSLNFVFVSTTVAGWYPAVTTCKAKSAKLPSIHSAADNDKVKALYSKANNWIWLGIKKDWQGLTWEDGTPVDYTNWGPGKEPTSDGCGYMEWNGFWDSRDCGHENRYVCVN